MDVQALWRCRQVFAWCLRLYPISEDAHVLQPSGATDLPASDVLPFLQYHFNGYDLIKLQISFYSITSTYHFSFNALPYQ